MSFTQEQVDKLLAPIKPRRVYQAQGQSHVAAFDVIAHLTRIFGFGGWDKTILSLDLVHERIVETPNADPKKAPTLRCWVTYRCLMRLSVKDPYGDVMLTTEDAATGSAQNMPGVGDAHDFAVKNAVSYALKRCAKDLGDQFGLSLYNKGQTGALVGVTLVQPDVTHQGDVEDHAPEPLTLGNDELEPAGDGEGEGQGTANVPVPPPVPCQSSTWEKVAGKLANLDAGPRKALQTAVGFKITSGMSEDQAQQVLAWEPDK